MFADLSAVARPLCPSRRRGLLAAALLLALVLPLRAQDDLVTSGAVRGTHDPVIIREGKTYYVFHTSGRGGTDIRTSPDLVNWKTAGKAFTQIPAWGTQLIPSVRNIWAPDISFHNGKYFLYYSGSQFGKNNSFIGLMTTPTLDPANPAYKWSDEGLIIRSQQGKDAYNCIDSNAVYDQQGGMWLVFGSFFSGIQMFQLDPATGKPAQNPPQVFKVAGTPHSAQGPSDLNSPLPPDSQGIEAPFIVFHDGYYYLFCSYDLCCKGLNSTYKIGVGRSKTVQGPYVDREGRPMSGGGYTPVLKGMPPVVGPGHCGLLMNDNGTDWLVHHFYDGRLRGQTTLQVRPIVWTADGWPTVGLPYGGPTPPVTPTMQNMAGRWLCSTDFGKVEPLTLGADGTTSRGLARGTWRINGKALELGWPETTPAAAAPPAAAQTPSYAIEPDGRLFAGFDAAGKVVRAWRAPAGK